MVHALEQIILPQILSQFYELCATAGGNRKLFYTALTEDGRKAPPHYYALLLCALINMQ